MSRSMQTRYGLRDKDIERNFQNKGCLYLIVNPEGAEKLKQTYGDHVVRLFIYADRKTIEMRQRAEGLGEEDIAERLVDYETDIAYQPKCEHALKITICPTRFLRLRIRWKAI